MTWTKRLEKLLKKTALHLLRAFSRPDPPLGAIRLLEIGRILVVRPDNRIGNLILITPLLQAIRNAFPKAHLTLLTGRSFPALLSGHPALSEILVADQRRFLRNPFYLVRFLRRLKGGSYDLAVDASLMHSLSFTAGALVRLTRAPLRLGYDRPHSDLFLNVRVPPVSEDQHEMDLHLRLLRFLIGDLKAPSLYLPISRSHRSYAAQFFAERIAPDRMAVGLHLGGRRGKRWPPEHFAALTDRLIEDFDVQPVIFWGKDDQSAAQRVQSAVEHTPLWIPPGPVERLPALIAQCAIFISSDIGPMHMAAALGVPTIAIFVVENYRRYGPRGPQHRIVFRQGERAGVEDVRCAFEDLMRYLEGHPEYRGSRQKVECGKRDRSR